MENPLNVYMWPTLNFTEYEIFTKMFWQVLPYIYQVNNYNGPPKIW